MKTPRRAARYIATAFLVAVVAIVAAALLSSAAHAGIFDGPDLSKDAEYQAMSAVSEGLAKKFTYVTDIKLHGVEQYVDLSVTGDEPFAGDCEEYALAALIQLRRRGSPASFRRVLWNRQGHALVVGKVWCIDTIQPGPVRCDDLPSLGYKAE